MSELVFACPDCAVPLSEQTCPNCGRDYGIEEGIHRFLLPERAAELKEFLEQYRLVRERDGYRSFSADEYRALPFVASGHAQADVWRVRRESFDRLIRHLVARPLRVLDLGAGNGWLSNRLAALGHDCVAVDLLDDAEDGLGACRNYESDFLRIQADFNSMPFRPAQFDVAVFNASLHYAPNPSATLVYVDHMLVDGGQVFILDSPTFRFERSGRAMLSRQEARLRSLTRRQKIIQPGRGFLTRRGMSDAGWLGGRKYKFHPSLGGLNWAARRVLSGIKSGGEPAAFGVWHGIMSRKTDRAHVSPGAAILKTARRGIAFAWLTVKNRLFLARNRHLVMEEIEDVSLVVLPEVFNPVLFRTGAYLARAVDVSPLLRTRYDAPRRVLDLGCGSGVGAVFAARRGARVIASDLNPEAVRCTRTNAMLNQLEDSIETRCGDLFDPLQGERFDLVLFNPPFYRGAPKDDLDMAWRGENIFERFAAELKDHLNPNGAAMIVLSTHGEGQSLLTLLQSNGFESTPFISRDLGNEVITVYSVIPRATTNVNP